MSTFVDRDLEVHRPGTRSSRSGLFMRPGWSTAGRSARWRLTGDGEVLERAATRSSSVRADWVPGQGRIKSALPSAQSQTVFLVGELDVGTAVVGRLQLRGALETGQGPLVIDCSAVRFIDAAWLGVLVSTARYGAQLGRKVTVAATGPRVLRALHLVGLRWLLGEE
jgi:anti-sigma B factor antagonist